MNSRPSTSRFDTRRCSNATAVRDIAPYIMLIPSEGVSVCQEATFDLERPDLLSVSRMSNSRSGVLLFLYLLRSIDDNSKPEVSILPTDRGWDTWVANSCQTLFFVIFHI